MIKSLLIVFIILSLTHNANAQTIDYNQPYNSSYLAKYGISPQVFNISLSPMYQEEVFFSAELIIEDKTGDVTNNLTVQLDYDPYYNLHR